MIRHQKTIFSAALLALLSPGLQKLSVAAVAPLTPPPSLPGQSPTSSITRQEITEDFHPEAAKANPYQKSGSERLLSEVTRDFLGIDQETPESRQDLTQRALLYLRYKKNALSRSERASLLSSCNSKLEPQAFCQDLSAAPHSQDQRAKKDRLSKQRAEKSAKQNAQRIQAGDFESLKILSQEDLREALKKIREVAELDSILKKVLQAKPQPGSPLPAAFAFKMEEFLPNDTARKAAIQLYEKAIQEETGVDETALRVRLRLSLLKIWENNCPAALPHLKFLSENSTPTTDFAPRALFWKHQCGIQLKKSEHSTEAKKALFQRYPFSLQSVLIQMDEPSPTSPHTTRTDSPTQARIQGTHPFNLRIREIEALLKLREPEYARQLLNRSETQLDAIPARVKLYLAALTLRMDDSIRRFKLLSSAFREDPNLLSKTSLELFYPRKTDLTPQHKVGSLDPMLVLSLIRQESAFNIRARSPAGAMGLMQIMPKTARRFHRMKNPNQLYNPTFNLEVGSRYFSNLLRNYDGDAELALAAYNAGPKRVEEWLKRYPVKDRALFIDLIPFKETRDYVSSIARNYFWYVSLYSDRLNNPTEGRKELGKVFNLFKS